jgi:hypothetical protein
LLCFDFLGEKGLINGGEVKQLRHISGFPKNNAKIGKGVLNCDPN